MTPLEAALKYTGNGWRVVPVLPGQKRPALTRWTEAATSDEATVRTWWEQEHPDAGVGIVTGPGSGLWVLDVDDTDALVDLEERHGRLPSTLTSITGSGGLHLFFRWPEGVEVRNDAGRRLGPGLDVRGEGGFVVAPPTIHPNGSEYAWDLGEPDAAVDAPAWLLDLVTREEERPERPAQLELARSDRPGDRWAAATSWAELLGADGWTLHHTDRSGESHWTRPGKDPREGTSATTNYEGSDILKVFTSNPPAGLTEGETYSKLGYLAATRFSGDHTAAARFLVAQGWGSVASSDLEAWVDIGSSADRDGGNAERSAVRSMVAKTIEAAPAPAAETDDGWAVVDLGALLDGSYDPPVPTLGRRTDGVGLLYPGRVHSFSGEPGGGKTWLSLAHGAEVLADGGSVGFIDYEDTPAAIVSRLQALGVSVGAIRERFTYVRPDGPVGNVTMQRFEALALELWIVDSVGEAIAVEGLNPNADEDVARWYRLVPRRLAASGSAVELLDHVAKDRETRGSWAIGSQRKLAAIDGAAYVVDVVKAPTREDDGLLRLKCAKDRHGTHQRGHVVAEVEVLNGDDGAVGVTVRAVEGPVRPTAYMEKVSRWMEDNALDAPFTKNALTKGVGGKAAKIREAIGLLIDAGYVELKSTTAGQFHTLQRPYRQEDDPQSDRFDGAGVSQFAAIQAMAQHADEPVDNSSDSVDFDADGPDRVPASHRVPSASRTHPETERVPASPAYVVAGMQGRGQGDEEPEETTQARPAYSVPDEDEDQGDVEDGDW